MTNETQNFEDWRVRADVEPVSDWDQHDEPLPPETSGHEVTVTIFTNRDVTYRATADNHGLTALEIIPTAPNRVTRALLRDLPLETITAVVRGVVQDVGEDLDEGVPLSAAVEAVTPDMDRAKVRASQMDVELFAQVWRNVHADTVRRDGRLVRRSKRNAVAAYLDRSISSVDQWLRKARDAGLIDPADQGRRTDLEVNPEE